MKKIVFFIALLLSVGILSCDDKEDNKNKYPQCMQMQIDEFMSNSKHKIGAIKKYKYQDNIVYVFWKFVANEQIDLLDKDCNIVKSMIIGGVAGSNPRMKDLEYIETVWEYSKIEE